ncbi:hypothetical protein H9Q72_014477 [Fusarium xylarioides]|uniref:Uncharacterized protein n=1 Tax=Fusarium xylarioides TaxID=221167 RepID=A0A9P7HGW8_9HYPO|nr:hypothetical protein H9Q72_014477 [Fusarium xylarioides]
MSRSPSEGHCDPGGSAPPEHPARSHLNPAATSFQPRSSTSHYFLSGQASYNSAAWSTRGMSSTRASYALEHMPSSPDRQVSTSEHYSTYDSDDHESPCLSLASHSTHDSADAESTHPNLASHSAMSDTDESRADKHNRQIEDPMEAVFREISDRTGAAANQKGEPSKNKEGELVFKMGRSSTNFFHSIITIGDKPLPGFDAATIARLGIGPFPGLHCRTRMSAGQLGRPILHIELCIRHLCNVNKFMDIIVPLDRVLDDVTLVDVESTDDTALSPLYAFEAFDMEGLARQPGHDGQK